MRLKRAHIIVGLLVIIIFLLTGQYMEWLNVSGADDGARMMFRSRHIYLLLAGLVNLCLGMYFQYRAKGRQRVLQMIGSALILTSPALLIAAFFYEPPQSGLPRTFTLPAILSLLTGALLHLVGGFTSKHDDR